MDGGAVAHAAFVTVYRISDGLTAVFTFSSLALGLASSWLERDQIQRLISAPESFRVCAEFCSQASHLFCSLSSKPLLVGVE
uniref:Uncharacterized protein n=1 Tax=mine drainage metagenome TaxID=410659 RepID=E6PV05_9ZZZZ